jgi:signal peptidase I
MHPTIRDGEVITVAPVAPSDVKEGDIVLYLVDSKVFAHRVVGIQRKEDDETAQSATPNSHHLFILRGDASGGGDDPVAPEEVLGKVVSVERAGRTIDPYSKKANILRTAYACTSRLKRCIIQ